MIPLPGIDHLLQQASLYKGKRMALVTNNAAFTSNGISSRVALLKSGFNVIKLFSPEHGLNVHGADGAFQKNSIDELTKLPIISLYGDRLAPTEDDFHDVDVVVFDIPDVGCRFYTYLWTMTHVMKACALYGKTFVLADRPNPISGEFLLAEGPMLDEEHCSSFIGRWNIPIRHSCTLGELALYFAGTKIKNSQPQIIKITGWKRREIAGGKNGKFIPTSPAIQNMETALLYPGMGLLEGINVNEGRGTDKPFRICGAPWIDGHLQQAFINKKIPGIVCKNISYTPSESLYAHQLCHGLEFFIDDVSVFRPVATGIALLQTIMELYPQHVKERLYCTRANPSGSGHLDKLLGVQNAFDKLKNGERINTDVAQEWTKLIQPFLLY